MGGWNRHEEAELVHRARAGDEDSLVALVEACRPAIEARVRRLLAGPVRRKVSVSDVLQQAYLVALRHVGVFEDRGDGSFGRWFGRIAELEARALVRRYLGTHKRNAGREVSRGARADTAEFRSPAPSPSQLAMAKELSDALPEALARLAPDHREVLRLLQEEGVTFEEAARRLGRTLGATRKLYGRSLARLAELLGVRARGRP